MSKNKKILGYRVKWTADSGVRWCYLDGNLWYHSKVGEQPSRALLTEKEDAQYLRLRVLRWLDSFKVLRVKRDVKIVKIVRVIKKK